MLRRLIRGEEDRIAGGGERLHFLSDSGVDFSSFEFPDKDGTHGAKVGLGVVARIGSEVDRCVCRRHAADLWAG